MTRRLQVAAAVVVGVAFLGLGSTAVEAQRHYHGGYHGSAVFVGGYFYDPFWGPYPWWPAAAYPYSSYPIYDATAEIRVLVTPKDAAVYLDGFYAGIVDDFDGFLQRLPVSPGGHDLVLYMPGYRTVHQSLYAAAASTLKVKYAMEKLPAGETSEPPPVAPPVPPPPDGSALLPPTRVGAPLLPTAPVPQQPRAASEFGTLVVRAQPPDAVITIDGEPWTPSDARAGLAVQVAEGRHRIEIRKTGFKSYSAEVVVRAGESTPLNVSLSPE